MKKYLSAVLCLLLVISLCGCGGSSSSSSDLSSIKAQGAGEKIEESKQISFDQIRKYSNAAYIVDYCSSCTSTIKSTCLQDNTVIDNYSVTFKKEKSGEITSSTTNNKGKACVHYSLYDSFRTGDWEFVEQSIENGYIRVLFKSDITGATGYMTSEYHLDPDTCFTLSLESILYLDGQAVEKTVSENSYKK